MADLEIIRARASELLHHLIDLNAFRREGSELRGNCPWRPESNSRAFTINPQTGEWFDHARNEGGDLIELVQRIRGCDFKAAVVWCEQSLGIVTTTARRAHAPTRTSTTPARAVAKKSADGGGGLWRNKTPKEAMAAFEQLEAPDAGMVDWFDDHYGLGSVPADCRLMRWPSALPGLSGPEPPEGVLYLARDAEGEPAAMKWKSIPRNDNGKRESRFVWGNREALLGVHRLRDAEGKVVVFVAGEEKLALLSGLGFVAVGGLFGEKALTDSQAAAIAGAKPSRVVCACDADEAGEKANAETARKLVALGVPVAVVCWPDGVSRGFDVNDMAKGEGGGDAVRRLIESAIPWEPAGEDATDPGESWPTPKPLATWTPPPFPLEEGFRTVPRIREYLEALATETQTPVDMAGTLLLGVVSLPMAGRARVQVRPGWEEPPNLFLVVAMPSGSRKSAVFARLTRAARDVERELAREAAKSRHAIEARRIRLEEEKKTLRTAKGADKEARLAEVLAELSEPVPATPRLFVDDVTIEALAEELARQGGVVCMASPEGGAFGRLYRYGDSGGADFDLFLKGHGGEDFRSSRVRRGSDVLDIRAARLILVLCTQPDALEEVLANREFRDKGLLARFLYAVPESNVGRRAVNAPPVPECLSEAFDADLGWLFREAYRTPPGNPATVRLEPAATALIEAFMEEIEPELAYYGKFGDIRDWASKSFGAVARIAASLHALGCASDRRLPWCEPIRAATVRAALALGRYFLKTAKGLLGERGGQASDAEAVLRWIGTQAVKGQLEFTRAEVQSRFKNRMGRDQLTAALELLERHGYLREGTVHTAGRPSSRFRVNPSLRVEKEDCA